MTNEQIKQAYVIGKAAKGVLRFHAFQKQAMLKQADEKSKPEEGNTSNQSSFDFGKTMKDYAAPIGIPTGIGAILGAIINGAQGKSVLKGLLTGGAIGGLGGAGYKAYDLYANGSPAATDIENSGAPKTSPTT